MAQLFAKAGIHISKLDPGMQKMWHGKWNLLNVGCSSKY